VTVAAESLAGSARVGVALVTDITVVVMKRSVRVEHGRARGMEAGIGSPDTVGIEMTAGAGAGRIGGVVTGGTVLDIAPRRAAVVGQPGNTRMQQRQKVLALVAVVAECTLVVAPRAVEPFALRVEAVRVHIIQVVYAAGKVVAPVTIKTGVLSLMALPAPVAIQSRFVTVSMAPVSRMNIGQRQAGLVAGRAVVIRLRTVVADEAGLHLRHKGQR